MRKLILLAALPLTIIFIPCLSKAVRADQVMKRAVAGVSLIREGKEFERREKYAEALELYNKALVPDLASYDFEKAHVLGIIRKLYIKWGKYEDAKKTTGELLKQKKKLNRLTDELVWEIDALIEFQKTGNPQKILDHIEYLKKQYAVSLPPKPWNGGTSTIAGKLFRFYNLIGDHDSGIKLIDDSFKVFREYDMKKYGKPKLGRTDTAYQAVRDGFERDKAEGFKGCAQSPPGVVCMGHATRAMIQTREFSW